MWWYPNEKESTLQMIRIHESFFNDVKAEVILKLKAKKLLNMISERGLKYRSDGCGDKDWYIEGKRKVYFK